MYDLAHRLNEILGDEWACVRTLRRGETQCSDPGQREVIKRVRKDCSLGCVNLAKVIRAIGGRPTDRPSPRFSLQLTEETLADILDLAQSAQAHILAEIDELIDEPELKTARAALNTVRHLHRENIHWLNRSLVGQNCTAANSG